MNKTQSKVKIYPSLFLYATQTKAVHPSNNLQIEIYHCKVLFLPL